MVFNMTYKLYGLSRSLWPICDSIQRIIREISAIESLMTSCLLDRKWHKKCFLRKKKVIFILPLLKQVWFRSDDPTVNNGIFQFKYNDDVIPRQPEGPLSTTTVDKLKKFGHELTELWTDKPSDKKEYEFTLPLTPKVKVTFKVT